MVIMEAFQNITWGAKFLRSTIFACGPYQDLRKVGFMDHCSLDLWYDLKILKNKLYETD